MGPQIETGRIFGDSFRLLIGHFGTFVGAAYLVYLPLILALGGLMLSVGGMPDADDPAAIGIACSIQGIAVFGRLIAAPLVTAISIRGVARHLRGEPVALGDSLRFGRGLVLPVLALSILIGIGSAIGVVFCLLPGIILYTGWFVAPPVLVVERQGVFESLRRSWELTDGNRLRIFFVVVGLWLLSMGVGVLAALVAVPFDVTRWAELFGVVVEPFATALAGVVAAVTYFAIRRVREDLDPAQLEDVAALFD